MKKQIVKFIIFSLIFSGVSLNAQNFQGKAVYESKTKLDIDMSGSGMSADRIKMIKERMKSNLEKTFELAFDKTASIYTEEETLGQAGNSRGGMRMVMIGSAGGATGEYYKNSQTKKSIKENEFSGKNFLIKDSLKSYEWKMEQETKMIGNYLCFKATTVIEVPVRDTQVRFGRRGGNDEEKEEKEEDKEKENEIVMEVVIVTAWYTLDIPVSHGPGDYWGLPGLILEVKDRDTHILCSKIVLNPKEKKEITEPTKGKVVSQEEYDTIIEEKMKEMRERFRNERQKSGDGAHRIRIGG